MPKYTHDCDHCEYLGTYFDHDVYLCQGDWVSIVARHGDEGSEYASMPLAMFLEQLEANNGIGGIDLPGGSMLFRDYCFSNYSGDDKKAMILALALRSQEEVTDEELHSEARDTGT